MIGIGIAVGNPCGVALGGAALTMESFGTLKAWVNTDSYTLVSTKLTETPDLAASPFVSVWNSGTEANRPVIAVAAQNGLDLYDYIDSTDVIHVKTADFDTGAVDIAGAFTVAMVFKSPATLGQLDLFAEDWAAAANALFVTSGNQLAWWDGATTNISATGLLAVNTLYILIVTRDGSNNFKAYLNAADVTSGSPSKAGVFQPQMIGHASGATIKVGAWGIYSDLVTDINGLGQLLSDRWGAGQIWSI